MGKEISGHQKEVFKQNNFLGVLCDRLCSTTFIFPSTLEGLSPPLILETLLIQHTIILSISLQNYYIEYYARYLEEYEQRQQQQQQQHFSQSSDAAAAVVPLETSLFMDDIMNNGMTLCTIM